ncbi:MAG TPA: hypothetical protein VFN61_11440 [Acidimicrobiales bacterium]|nr:hypothetical protein [Acidimicrobiales bacterium]
MTDHRSLISAISSYVAATSTTLAGRRCMAAWALTRPGLARYKSVAELVRECRDSGPQRQDKLLTELLSVPADGLAHIAILASLSPRLSGVLATWRRGGASATDLKDLEAALVSECWAEILALSDALSEGHGCPEGLAVLIVERARQRVRAARRREVRALYRRMPIAVVGTWAAGPERSTAERLGDEVAEAVRSGRLSATAARPVYLTRVLGYSDTEAAVRLGYNQDVLRATRSRAERALVA